MIKRLFDLFFSLIGFIVLSPVFLCLLAWVFIDDPKHSPFYRQIRVGKNGRNFGLFKFRSMRPNADKAGKLTVGSADSRVTTVGRILRKYKLDELPQFFNIINGDMSFVGPRPEVPEFVNLYTPDQRRVLEVAPGLTDFASLKYIDENELLAKADNPHQYYIDVIMPDKIKLGIEYVERQSLLTDLQIIFRTLMKIVS